MLGEAKGEIWLMAFWFDGRIFKEGEVGGIVDGAICVDVRLEFVLEVRRGEDSGRGDEGTVFRSGGMALRERQLDG